MRQISTETITVAVKDAAIAGKERIPMCRDTIQCHASRHLEIIL